MLESERLTPEEGEETEEEIPQETEPELGDIEPKERQSKLAKLQEEAEYDRRMKRLEFETRKLKEENEAMRKELGGEYKAPSQVQEAYDYNPYSEKIKEMESMERMNEVKDFVRDNPDYKHLAPALDKFANHPAYERIPVDFIAKALNYDTAKKSILNQDSEARKKAQMSQTGGSPITKKEKTEIDYASMSHEEFEKQLAKVKRGN